VDTTVLEPVGVAVTGDAADLDPAALRTLLADHGVVVLRDQDLDDDGFEAFLRGFGDLVFTVGETPVDGHPDLNVVSNVGRTTPPRSSFHVDTSYVSRPPAYTALRAVTVPAVGGQTLFTNQYAAYATLPDDVRTRLAGRTVRHVVTGVDPGDAQEHAAEHPVFRPHPLTGRVALYLSTPARCVAVSGLPDDEAAEVIAHLYAHSTAPGNTLRHGWRPGDVVMWDNACVLHKADHSGVVGDRVMHRGMVATYPGAA
jgi:taurine dioxygenase